MTPAEIHIIKTTWKIFRSISPAVVGDVFYSKLFTENRSLRKMFPVQMEAQYRKLVDMLNSIVLHLDDMDSVAPEIKAMAVRHTAYGVRPAHYKIVGDALLWTLQQGLGRDWNANVEAAWRKCYTTLATIMITAANEAQLQQ